MAQKRGFSPSEQIQHRIEVDRFPDMDLVRGPGQVMEQKFQHHRTAKTPPLDLEIGKAHRQIRFRNIPHPDEAWVFHRLGKAIPFRCIRGGAAVLRAGLAEIFAAGKGGAV